MKVRIFQKGFNYSQDGDGNRLIYHLQGCNMKCPWCANPEGMPPDGAILVEEELLLDSDCPHGAVKEKKLDRAQCAQCNDRGCVTEHAGRGIQCSFVEYDVDTVLDEIVRSRPMFYDGGGVTFTGGEPTLQFNALEALLKGSKEAGVHTAIESNASSPKFPSLFPLIDQLIMDFKHYDNEKHLAFTGIPNEMVKQNLSKAIALHPNVHIRIPVIGGFNNAPEDIQHFADFFCQYNTKNVSFEVLAYHEYGKIKWEQCGLDYQMKDAYVSSEIIQAFETIFTERGLHYLRT